mmetsp:Transcript_6134/g.9845  ORF Transcript_6134/g.9845 Transcript_6134/m.9845 type:complete len:120 (-) Transcript_6134:1117-1476(-)
MAERSFFVWKKMPGQHKIKDLKALITLEDMKQDDISLVDEAKVKQGDLHEHLRITNDQNIELGDGDPIPGVGQNLICLNLEIRVAAHEKQTMRSTTDTNMLNMLSVVRQFNEKLEASDP